MYLVAEPVSDERYKTNIFQGMRKSSRITNRSGMNCVRGLDTGCLFRDYASYGELGINWPDMAFSFSKMKVSENRMYLEMDMEDLFEEDRNALASLMKNREHQLLTFENYIRKIEMGKLCNIIGNED